jgi:uncharacterized protein DUF6226
MADRWGAEGPPREAYSRVTRDLAAVTAGFAAWLDELPRRLTATYDCMVREPAASDLARLGEVSVPLDEVYVVQPADDRSAPLLVARTTHEGGAGVLLRTGVAIDVGVPGCFCDACDEDSDSLIEQTDEIVSVAVEGCREFRQRYRRSLGQRLADGPWLEHGYERPDGGAARHASASVRGDTFSRVWEPWPRRQAS